MVATYNFGSVYNTKCLCSMENAYIYKGYNTLTTNYD